MPARRRASLTLAPLAATVLLVATAAGAGGPRYLNRSLYVPVHFELCPHLEDALLYAGDELAGRLPTDRIFQFTYYPDLGRIEPRATDLRVEGRRTDGGTFVARLAVTPEGIYTARRRIELDVEKQIRRLRYRIDVRYEPVRLRLRCSDACPSEAEAPELGPIADGRGDGHEP